MRTHSKSEIHFHQTHFSPHIEAGEDTAVKTLQIRRSYVRVYKCDPA